MYLHCKFCENPPSGFSDSAHQNILPKINKTSIKCTNSNLKKIYKDFSNIVFAYFAHGKFQTSSFISNRDIRQNVALDGGDGDGPQNNTSRRFSKNGREVTRRTTTGMTVCLISKYVYSGIRYDIMPYKQPFYLLEQL